MKRKTLNTALLVAGLAVLAGSVLFLAVYWGRMPEQIPTHFDAAGQIDGWGDRATALLLPIVGVLLFGMLHLASFLCASMKSSGGVRPMLAMAILCRVLALLTALVFAYITICSALVLPLGRWFLWTAAGSAAAAMAACIIWACVPAGK